MPHFSDAQTRSIVREAYARVPRRGGWMRPLLFAMIVGGLGYLVGDVWQRLIGDPVDRILPREWGLADPEPLLPWWTNIPLVLLFLPFFLLLYGFLLHLALLLTGGTKHGPETTLRAVFYAESPALLNVLPLCGGYVGTFWSLALAVVGIGKEASEAELIPREGWLTVFVQPHGRLATVALLLAAIFLLYPTDYEHPGWRGSFDLAFARHTRIGLRTPVPGRQPATWRTANSRIATGASRPATRGDDRRG